MLDTLGMTSQPVTYEPFPDVDDLGFEIEGESDVLGPVRGILVAVALCAPFWAAVYLMLRSFWS